MGREIPTISPDEYRNRREAVASAAEIQDHHAFARMPRMVWVIEHHLRPKDLAVEGDKAVHVRRQQRDMVDAIQCAHDRVVASRAGRYGHEALTTS